MVDDGVYGEGLGFGGVYVVLVDTGTVDFGGGGGGGAAVLEGVVPVNDVAPVDAGLVPEVFVNEDVPGFAPVDFVKEDVPEGDGAGLVGLV